MNREEFANLLKNIKNVHDKGGTPEDLDAFLLPYANRNVYFYNDACVKKILASQENIPLTVDLVNASLDLKGSDCFECPSLSNPYIPGELGIKSVEPDILLRKSHPVFCGTKRPDDVVSVEFQHNGGSIFSDRLMLYVARHTSRMVAPGDVGPLDNLNLISFQHFDTYPWEVCRDYRYTIKMRTQNNLVYYNKQTITLVEVKKFLDHADYFVDDDSRLAQWLRVIDALNREDDDAFAKYAGDPIFQALHKSVKLCNFDSGYLLKESKHMTDIAYEKYIAAEEGRAEGREAGLAEGRAEGHEAGLAEGSAAKSREMAKRMLLAHEPEDKIVAYTGLSVEEICQIK